jgi:translation elongation factor EF-4
MGLEEEEVRSSDSEFIKNVYKNVIQKDYDKDIRKLSKSLLKKMAEDVKKWRTEGKGYSWRYIAMLFADKYPEFSEKHNIVAENQLCGIYLCEAAIIKLNETEQNWN